MFQSFWSSRLTTAPSRVARVQVFMQRLRQQHGRAGVGAQVGLHGGEAEALGAVVLEGGGAVDHGIHRAKPRDHRWQQRAHARLVCQVGKERQGAARAAGERVAVACGLLRVCHGMPVVHRHVPARARQRERDFAAQAFACAGDEHGARGLGSEGFGWGHDGQSAGEHRHSERTNEFNERLAGARGSMPCGRRAAGCRLTASWRWPCTSPVWATTPTPAPSSATCPKEEMVRAATS